MKSFEAVAVRRFFAKIRQEMLSNLCNEKMLDFSGQGLRILVGILQVSFDYGNLEFIRTY